MERHGFIHDILDVKMLILYVMNLAENPVTAQTIYELCYQDDCLSYFDVQESIPQMVDSGHLSCTEDGRYVITEKGREAEEITQNAIAFPVKHRAKLAVERLNRQSKREEFLHTEIESREGGEYVVIMTMDDSRGRLMKLELTAPTRKQAKRLEASYWENAEVVYRSVLLGLLEDEAEEEEVDS